MDAELTHHNINTNGIRLHVVEAGSKNGKPILLLHGFPEFWYGWIHQIRFLAEKGYHVLIPDQRGYNLSDKPPKKSDYEIDHLAKDMIGVLAHFGYEKADVVGHDWGAGVAWWLAINYSEHVNKLVILNVPHPRVMQNHIFKNIRQTMRSWYIFFFQLPFLPELMLRRSNYKPLRKVLKKTSVPDAYSEEDLQKYITSWSQPKALTSMINWYRAMRGSAKKNKQKLQQNERVTVPTYIIWGEQDSALGKEMVQPSIEFCDHGKVTRIPEATHWLLREYPERVNTYIYDFLSE